VRVPQGGGVSEHGPRNWWLTKLMTAVLFEFGCADGGSSPPLPPFSEKAANAVVADPIRVGEGYRRRWIIERCFGWMTNYRRLVVRYDRYLHIYRAFCLIAFIIWCVNRILK